jgi:hypothetical protein
VKSTFAATLFLLPALASPGQWPDQTWFRSDKSELSAGGNVKLTWHSSAATSAYLSGFGLVENPKNGSATVSPPETTDYVLILEIPSGPPQIFSQRIVVRGAKGSAGEWPADPFQPLGFERNYPDVAASLAMLARTTERVLQDSWKFQIRRFSLGDGEIVFYTAFSQEPSLIAEEDRGKKVRRIAYRVALSATAVDRIQVNLSARIDWKPVIDRTWFQENSLTSNLLYQTQIDALKTVILGK